MANRARLALESVERARRSGAAIRWERTYELVPADAMGRPKPHGGTLTPVRTATTPVEGGTLKVFPVRLEPLMLGVRLVGPKGDSLVATLGETTVRGREAEELWGRLQTVFDARAAQSAGLALG